MAKRKWYVVIVGKDIGVFPTWLEAGPLVKGVSEALHQSFPTEDEARRVFAKAKAAGNTRIVNDDDDKTASRGPRETGTYDNSPVSVEVSPRPYNPPAQTPTGNMPLRGHNGRPTEQCIPSTPSQSRSPISRSASELSASSRRLDIINAFFSKDPGFGGVEARASSVKHAQAATEPMTLHSSYTQSVSQSPRVIVKTPSWLASYPQAPQPLSQPLSPLNSADLLLNTLRLDRLYEETTTGNRNPVLNASRPTSPTKSPSQESVDDSPIYLTSEVRSVRVTYEHNVDPRSPILNGAQVPELTFMSSLSFARPSPSLKREQLPLEFSGSEMKSSLLFEPTPSSLG